MKKIGNSFKGIFGGIIAIVIGVILLWWNEGNNVKNLKTTSEMDKTYIDVDSEAINPANEGKLVATHGPVINEQELSDDLFGVKVKTPVLKRIVEVYQWKEVEHTDEDDHTTYTYEKVWASDLINSDNFSESGHENPKNKLYENNEYFSTEVKVGAFLLSTDQVVTLSTNGQYTDFSEEKLNELKLQNTSDYLTNSADYNSPQIGDVRISFVYNNSTNLSVLAVQSGNSFVDFVSKAGKTVNRVMDGSMSGKEMINVIKKENKILKWVLRAVGAVLCMVGFATILKPISTITGFVPILGSIVGSAVGLVSFILGLALSLLVIAIAWVRFRPVLGIILLALVVVLIVFLIARGKKKPAVTNNTIEPNPGPNPEPNPGPNPEPNPGQSVWQNTEQNSDQNSDQNSGQM